jgi:hypothetical protein
MKGVTELLDDIKRLGIPKKEKTDRDRWKKSIYYKRDKRMNKPEFNLMAKKRRRKAKFDARGRKINQRVIHRRRK